MRSLLFIPANQPAMLQNAFLFDADALIFDLEDAVAPEEKDNARHLLHEFLQTMKKPPHVWVTVRVNGVDTEDFLRDVALLRHDSIDAFVLPKASAEAICRLRDQFDHPIKVIPIVEESYQILRMESIAKEEGVMALLLGGEDLARDMGATRSKLGNEIAYARGRVVMIAAAYHLISIDTPYTDVLDDIGFETELEIAKSYGMKAKSAIHPRHVEGINRTFSPSVEEIRFAEHVMEALKAGKSGSFRVDGRMVDRPIVDRAKQTLERAKQYGLVKSS